MSVRPEVVIASPCPSTLPHGCRCTNQVIVEGEICIPPQKPDFEKIIEFRVSSEVTHCEVIETPLGNKVVVSGTVNIDLKYVADFADQPMHFAHFVLPFHTFMLCALPVGYPCDCTVCVEHANFSEVGNRCLNELVVLFVCCS